MKFFILIACTALSILAVSTVDLPEMAPEPLTISTNHDDIRSSVELAEPPYRTPHDTWYPCDPYGQSMLWLIKKGYSKQVIEYVVRMKVRKCIYL